jgi:uncharacterized protein
MEVVVITVVSAIASLLSFFSGFGLGTILTLVFTIFFPIEVAITLSSIVHFLNNLFRIWLVKKDIEWKMGLIFGITSVIGAFIGALLLLQFSQAEIIYSYTIGDKIFSITYIKIIISLLMIIFALFDFIPFFTTIKFKGRMLYLGGLLSGFFGGFSGNQGALRSLFLLRTGLSKESFIATGVMLACWLTLPAYLFILVIWLNSIYQTK